MFLKQVGPRSVSDMFPNNPLSYEMLLYRTADANSDLSPLPLFPPSSLFIYPVYQPHKHTMSLNKEWVGSSPAMEGPLGFFTQASRALGALPEMRTTS